eukprot:681134-Rhodomonas_salina.1
MQDRAPCSDRTLHSVLGWGLGIQGWRSRVCTYERVLGPHSSSTQPMRCPGPTHHLNTTHRMYHTNIATTKVPHQHPMPHTISVSSQYRTLPSRRVGSYRSRHPSTQTALHFRLRSLACGCLVQCESGHVGVLDRVTE